MAMLNWQGWAATNFQGWGSAGAATPAATSVPAGGVRKRKRYFIRDKQYLLDDQELRGVLETVLRQGSVKSAPKAIQKPIRALQKAVAEAPAPARVTYPAAPVFDALWADLMQRQQHQMAEHARAVAIEMEIAQDDEDIFALLRLIEDNEG